MDFNTDFSNITNSGTIRNATKSITMNEAGIDLLAVETMQIAKTANDYLNKIIDIIDGTKTYYNTSSADELRAKFETIKTNFPIVIQNIENYAYSLKKAKISFSENVEVQINRLSNATLNVSDLIKKEGS